MVSILANQFLLFQISSLKMWPTQPSDHLLGHFDINSTEDEADGTTERP